MADIFSEWKINRLTIPNRIVRSATWEGLAQPDGTPGFDTVNLTADLATGGVGLVFAGYAFVRADGKGLPGQTGVHVNAMVGPLTRITEAVHRCGGLVGLQITHAGGQTKSEWIGGVKPKGPGNYVDPRHGEEVEMITSEEIPGLIDSFAMAAARAKAAGFDIVQLQCCHAYLISQFASPFYNKRDDEFGGSLENRARFGLMAMRAMRQAVGPDYPLCIKLNSTDGISHGVNLEDALELARLYQKAGADAIEVSGGIPAAGDKSSIRPIKGPQDEGYFFNNAKAVKAAVNIPVFPVGGWRRKAHIEDALEEVDAVALSRPLVREPDLVNKWRKGQSDAAECINCGGCLQAAMEGDLRCLIVDK
jgi:2,4-dienoyl-CoA reductase-like NADH-dependent reductase (Old Yellow Enzyme family)